MRNALTDGDGPRAVPVVAVCAAFAVAAAIALHGAPARSAAGTVGLIAQGWGVAAIAGAALLRHRAPTLAALLLAALAVRLPLIGTPLLLSDDAWRYLWEGAVLNAGINPFSHPPATVEGLDDALRARVNHPDLPSIYPPLALAWFRLLDLAGGAPWIAQAATAAFDGVTAACLWAVLRRRAAPTWPAWLYVLHPLPALESASNAHLEPIAVALCAVAVWAWGRERDGPAAAALVAAAAVKLLPLAILPSAWRWHRWHRQLPWLVGSAVVVIALALPVLDAGPDLLLSLRAYGTSWSFNGLVHPLLEPLLGDATRPMLAACAAAVVLAGWAVHREPIGTWAVAGAAFCLLSPTVHPWYVLWALVPGLLRGGWGWAVAAVPLSGSYLVLWTLDPATGAWQPQAWLPWVTWGPAIVALVAAAISGPDRR